ncbi:transposase, partial [Acidobacteriota bacterium]
MKHAKGERLNIRFNSKIKLEFHGARLTSDGGLLAYRELDDSLGLFNSASTIMSDKRTGRNIQHDMANLLRQSVYSRLAGYEDVNNAQRLSVDPVMRAVTGRKKNAASINTIWRFETEILPLKKNLEGLSEING